VSTWLLYLVISLVTFRVTRLVVKDTFPPIAVPRMWIINWWDPDEVWIIEHPKAHGLTVPHWGALGRSLRYLLTCPWCMSFWLGAAVVYVFTLYVSVPLPVVAWIVAMTVTGLIATNLDPD
jgi:hypothetical protein